MDSSLVWCSLAGTRFDAIADLCFRCRKEHANGRNPGNARAAGCAVPRIAP